MQGPLTKTQWGRIWARAFSDPNFKDTLEKSPRVAAEEIFGPVTPLFDTQDMNSYIRFFFNKLRSNAFKDDDRIHIRNGDFSEVDNQQELEDLKSKLKGNQFFFWKNGTPLCELPPQEIDKPQSPWPLKRDDWVRIYTEAFLAHSCHPDFRMQLESDPAAAVKEFDKNHTLGHVVNTPIFQFPTLDELNAVLPAGDPLKNNEAKLKEILQKIASGMPAEGYEAALEVTLSC